MAATSTPTATTSNNKTKVDAKFLKHKRRICQVEGCERIVKSQGRCQRHGAKPKPCKVAGCHKQAQGNFDGMCKSHFHQKKQAFGGSDGLAAAAAAIAIPNPITNGPILSVYDHIIPASIRWVPNTGTPFPLVHHLQSNFNKGTAWHRNEERLARGVEPVSTAATQLLGWERELVWTEILLLTGHPHTTFRHLARAWGRDKGFHRVLAQFICQRQGSVERKQQKGAGSTSTAQYATLPPPGPLAAATGTTEALSTMTADTTDNNASDEYHHHTAANIWDSACYYGMEYNEALAATLLDCVEDDDEEDTATSVIPPPPPPETS